MNPSQFINMAKKFKTHNPDKSIYDFLTTYNIKYYISEYDLNFTIKRLAILYKEDYESVRVRLEVNS